MVRLTTLTAEEQTADQKRLLTRLLGDGPIPESVALVATHPQLLEAWYPFSQVLQSNGRIPERDREIIVLRVAVHCGSAYVWRKHEEYGRRIGMSPEEIARVRRGAAASGWTPWEQTLIMAADELCSRDYVPEPVWAALVKGFDEAQLIELLFLVGEYRLLSGFFNSVHMPTPEAPRG